MIRLTDRKWQGFTIGELFNANRPISRREDDYLVGQVIFVASSAGNNGVTKLCQPKENEVLDKGNCLTVSPVDGSCFYQCTDFLGRGGAGSSIIILYPKDYKLNKYQALFISKAIFQTTSSKYSYGRMASLDRIKRDVICLPVTQENKPDFAFMDDYMRNQEKRLLEKYKDFFKQTQIDEEPEIQLFVNRKWEAFSVKDIFSVIQRGKRLKTEDHIIGQTPYVSSSSLQNGVDDFVSNNKGVRRFKNCITLANSGSVGETFYQPFEFVASDHVTKLENPSFDKYIYLFISTIVKRLSEKYSFNREINDARIRREKIMLPVDEKGKPDYAFMSAYMRRVEYEIQSQYLAYLEREFSG